MKQRSSTTPRRGVAAVELAFIMPFILTLLLSLWEVGRMIEIQSILSNAAREGARQAATGNFTNAQVQTIVTNYLTAAGIPTTNVVVGVSDLTSGTDVSKAVYLDQVQVNVSIPFGSVRWSVISVAMPSTSLMSASVTMVTMIDQSLGTFPTPPTG